MKFLLQKAYIKIYIIIFHTLLYNLTRSDEKHNKYIRFLDFNVKRDYCSCIIHLYDLILKYFTTFLTNFAYKPVGN